MWFVFMPAIEVPHDTSDIPGGPDPGAITLAQLRAFVATAEAGGFTAAARAVGTSQSAVSHAVKTLEAALGAGPLLSRVAGATPTAFGCEAIAEARAALGAVARLRVRAASAAGLASGHLRIAAVGSASARLLPSALRNFRVAHPSACVTVFEGTDAEIAVWVRDGVADLGIAACPEIGANTGLTVKAFTEDEFQLIVPQSHRLSGRRTVCPADLASEPFLMSSAGCEETISAFFATAGVTPRVVATVRDMPTLLAMTREGMGLTIVPALVLPDQNIGLRAISLNPEVKRQLVVLHSASHDPLPLTTEFLKTLRQAL